MKKGPLYLLVDWFLSKMEWINLVEYFKMIAVKIWPAQKVAASRFAVDLFIVLKWLLIALVWVNQLNNLFIISLVWYLIISNLYTYFYYHTWKANLASGTFDLDGVKRRFLNLLFAVSFNILCFGYLYAVPYSSNFNWSNPSSKNVDAFLFSVSNTITIEFEYVVGITKLAQAISMMESATTFIFLTIILSNSIPQTNTNGDGI